MMLMDKKLKKLKAKYQKEIYCSRKLPERNFAQFVRSDETKIDKGVRNRDFKLAISFTNKGKRLLTQ